MIYSSLELSHSTATTSLPVAALILSLSDGNAPYSTVPVLCGEGVDDCCMAIDDDFLLGRPLGVLRFDCFLRTMQQMTMTEMTMHNRPAAAPIAISVMGRANGGGSIGSCAV